MMAARADPAARLVRTPARTRLSVARCAFAPSGYGRADERAARPDGPRMWASIVISSILRQSPDRIRHLADERCESLARMPREGEQRCKLHDQGVAVVFQVEFEALGQIDGCAARGAAMHSCKGERGVLAQEQAADPSIDVAGDPKALPVAADEECRDRLADDVGIDRPKRRGAGRALGRRDAGASAFPRDRWSGHLPRSLQWFAGLLFRMSGIEGDRGHGGLLTNPATMMCRRDRRNARRPGMASHTRDIKAGAEKSGRCRAPDFMPRL